MAESSLNGTVSSSSKRNVPKEIALRSGFSNAYGILGLRAVKPKEVEPVLKQGLKHKGPVLMDIHTDPFENCYPMIPAGGCNHEMILDDPPELKKKQSGAVPVTPEDKDTVLTA